MKIENKIRDITNNYARSGEFVAWLGVKHPFIFNFLYKRFYSRYKYKKLRRGEIGAKRPGPIKTQ